MCKVCVDVFPDVQSRTVAYQNKVWGRRTELSVSFLGGNTHERVLTMTIANKISQICNMHFLWGMPNPDIRIAFEPGESWSYIGTDATLIPSTEPTMNLGWLTRDMNESSIEANALIKHEFGHALGLLHEHQHPESPILWNKEVVYRYYESIGWTRNQVDINILGKYNQMVTVHNDFDSNSIMLYPIPNEFTLGDYEVGWNTDFSPSDKSLMKRLYPFESEIFIPMVAA